jgi:nucleoside-diphosphate-sugar epimerase
VRLQSDGTPWRPLVHVRDIAAAFLAVLSAPREAVHNEAFNVGRADGNYQIRELAKIVERTVPGSSTTLSEGAGPDKRSYRVTFEKMHRRLPSFRPSWTAQAGAREMRDAIEAANLTLESFTSSRFMRIKRVRELMDQGVIDAQLRREATGSVSSGVGLP